MDFGFRDCLFVEICNIYELNFFEKYLVFFFFLDDEVGLFL